MKRERSRDPCGCVFISAPRGEVDFSAMSFTPLGDRALLITLGSSIDDATNHRVRALTARLEQVRITGLSELVPAFASIAIHYDPALASFDDIAAAVTPFLDRLDGERLAPARVVEIPVCYGGTYGPDLDYVARAHDLSPGDVVDLHTAPEYLVHMIGFAPGFPYLGGLDERLVTPRRDTPRTRVPAASVGIGGSQTGVYPIETPGGWHLIGRTPLRLFEPRRTPATLLAAGDRVRFRAISAVEFAEKGSDS